MTPGHVYVWARGRGEIAFTVNRPEWDDIGPAEDLSHGMAVDCLADNTPLGLDTIRVVLAAAQYLANLRAVIQLPGSPR